MKRPTLTSLFRNFTKVDYFLLIPVFIALFYTFYRAATLSLTHDEALIYFMALQNSAGQIIGYIIPQDHMLNTLLIHYSISIFPDSEFFIRLPNLLGHLLFIIYSRLLLRRLGNDHILIAGFIILNFNPYLLDFFSIARGYGLSVSLMMASIYFALSYSMQKRFRYLLFTFLFSVLAVLAVYPLLNYYVALSGWLGLVILIKWLKSLGRGTKPVLITIWFLAVFVASSWFLYFMLAEPLSRVTSEPFIYEKLNTNFYASTIRSVAFRSIYQRDPALSVDIISTVFFITMVALAITVIFKSVRKKNFNPESPGFTILVWILIIFLSVTVQYTWMNIRFLTNRTATFLIPVFTLTIIYLAYELAEYRLLKRMMTGVLYAAVALIVWNAALNMNFGYFIEWRYDASTRHMMKDIGNYTNELDDKADMGVHWLTYPAVNYYRLKYGYDWLEPVDKNGYEGEYDLYYVPDEDSIRNKPLFEGKKIIERYPEAGYILIK
jgi:hypothetical protein